MKLLVVIGVAFMLLGLVAFASQRISYTTREKIVDLGPVEATAEKEKTIPLPPILGAAAFAGGLVLVIVALRKD